MRIIGGELRGRRLQSLPGDITRPTTDKVRGAVFNSLFDVRDARVLDVFGGSGALALEAVSRGAAEALIMEADEKACRVITANVALCGMTQKVCVQHGDALTLLRLQREPFDCIFLDPPYGKGLLTRAIGQIVAGGLLTSRGTLVAETGGRNPERPEIGDLELVREKRYGNSTVLFYKLWKRCNYGNA